MDKIIFTLYSLSNDIGSIYSLFTSSVLGKFYHQKSIATNQSAVRSFYKDCSSLQSTSLSAMSSVLENGISTIENELEGECKKLFSEIKSDLISTLMFAYRTQMTLDVKAVKTDLFRFTIALMDGISSGSTVTSASVAANKSVRFVFVDRAGKRWGSERYISTVTRGEVIKGLVFCVTLMAKASGHESIVMSNGDTLSLTDIEKFSHPNSKLVPIGSTP